MRNDLHHIGWDRKAAYDSDCGNWSPWRRKNSALLEDLPTRERMRENVLYGREKWIHRAPLKGWLNKQVGRLWNDVYSEMCRTYDKRHNSKYKLHELLLWEVYTSTYVGVDDRLWARHPYGPREVGNGDLYVDQDGVLRKASFPKRVRPPKPVTEIRIDDTTEYAKFDGIWYRIEYKWVREEYQSYSYWWRRYEINYRDVKRVVRKKQLNKKELRRAGLKNGRCAM